MVIEDTKILSPGEVESELQSDEQQRNHLFSSLGRQSSIYSLTLDEFQHALCESGKNFGSMNMDEFLTSIWNAEENQVSAARSSHTDQFNHIETNSNGGNQNHGSNGHFPAISKQPSLPRQGSLSLPAPLCRKTVDEVWSEINRGPGEAHGSTSSNGNNTNAHNPEQSAQRQPTFGEMTLEDFLIKAGVVREQDPPPPPVIPSQQQQFGYGTNSAAMGTGYGSKPVGNGGGSMGYQAMAPQDGRNGGFGSQVGAAAQPVYGGGYAPISMGMSPVSPDGMMSNGADNQYGLDMGALRGRKRNVDGPVEKVVERRQRRMIKNRESAARSRARKQVHCLMIK